MFVNFNFPTDLELSWNDADGRVFVENGKIQMAIICFPSCMFFNKQNLSFHQDDCEENPSFLNWMCFIVILLMIVNKQS